MAVLAVLLGLSVGGCSLGQTETVDDNLVLPLPAGFEVEAAGRTSCGGIEDDNGAWRDLAIRPTQDPEVALTKLRAHLESRGFRFGPAAGPGPGQWARYRGATETVGAELGDGADYRNDPSPVGPNPAIARRAAEPGVVVLRLYPVQADCMT